MSSRWDAALVAAAWPGEPPRSRVLPGAVAAVVGLLAGPRAALWQLGAWGIAPVGAAIKAVVRRPRPALGRLNPMGGASQGPSFPSTHVSTYVACFGFASWLLAYRRSPAAIPLAAASAVLIGLIGPSRVRTGDHRWSDVLGGYALGAAFLAALVWAARRDRELRREPEWRGTVGFQPIAAGRVEVDAMVLLEADDDQVDQLLDQLGVPDLQR